MVQSFGIIWSEKPWHIWIHAVKCVWCDASSWIKYPYFSFFLHLFDLDVFSAPVLPFKHNVSAGNSPSHLSPPDSASVLKSAAAMLENLPKPMRLFMYRTFWRDGKAHFVILHACCQSFLTSDSYHRLPIEDSPHWFLEVSGQKNLEKIWINSFFFFCRVHTSFICIEWIG